MCQEKSILLNWTKQSLNYKHKLTCRLQYITKYFLMSYRSSTILSQKLTLHIILTVDDPTNVVRTGVLTYCWKRELVAIILSWDLSCNINGSFNISRSIRSTLRVSGTFKGFSPCCCCWLVGIWVNTCGPCCWPYKFGWYCCCLRLFFPSFFDTGFAFGRSLMAVF